MPARPTAPTPASAAAPANRDSQLGSLLMFSVAALLVVIVLAGFWLQRQRTADEVLREQANIYENYMQDTRPPSAPVQLPRSFTEAQAVREHLLNHPAVTPGAAFNQPGVQSTGKAIVDAMDQAKRL